MIGHRRWVLIAIAVAFGSLAVLRFAVPAPAASNAAARYALVTGDVLLLLALVLLAVALTRRQLYDASFFLGRALVFALLTCAIVALVGMIDWLINGVLAANGAALPIEVLCAIAVGFSLNVLRSRLEGFVDGLFFRRRHRAARQLARTARGLQRSDEEALVAPALTDEPCAALGLASAAIFVRVGDGAFAADIAHGWSSAIASVEPNHPFLLQLAGADHALRLDAPPALRGIPTEDPARPRVAVPIRVRGELAAFTVYGSHVNGADIDPDEIALLDRLALAASYAFDRADAKRMREINAELRAALAAAMAAG